MGERLPDFTCAICRRLIDMHWNPWQRASQIIPPICLCCEVDFSRGIGKPAAGSHMDRRIVMRGFALAEALRTAVAHRTWGGDFGSA